MSVWAAVILALVALAAVGAVAWPLVSGDAAGEAEDPDAAERRRVSEDLERSLAAIREIDMDHRAGNLSDDDFAALDAAERARAVALMKRADALERA